VGVEKILQQYFLKGLQGLVYSALIGGSASLGFTAFTPFSGSALALTQKAEAEPLETWIKIALDDKHRLHLQALQQLQKQKKLPVTAYRRLVPLLFSERVESIHASLALFQNQSAEGAWPELVQHLLTYPNGVSAPLQILLHWKNPEAIRRLAPWASSDSPRKRFLYAHLFGQHPMTRQDIPLLKPLLADFRGDVQMAAILGLLPTGDSEAWQAFELRLEDPRHGEDILMPLRFDLARGSTISLALPPCLPPVAFFEAERWLAQPEMKGGMQFRKWLMQPPGYRIWNGKQCVDYRTLDRPTQAQLKDAMYSLLQYPDALVHERVGGYLKAWLTR
jgi:hypothetical protein